jgi:hypothetical protein
VRFSPHAGNDVSEVARALAIIDEIAAGRPLRPSP